MALTEQKRLEQARRLRRTQTPAEVRLIVEVDGATHSTDIEIAYDARRTAYLKSHGYRVVRVLNDDIYRRFDDVMDMILLALEGKVPEAQ